MPSFPSVGHRQCRIPQRWLNSPNWPPGMVLTPKDPQIFGKAKSHQTHSYSQEARTLSPNLSASQSQDFILFFSFPTGCDDKICILPPSGPSGMFPIDSQEHFLSQQYQGLIDIYWFSFTHSWYNNHNSTPGKVEMSLVTGRDPYKQVLKKKAQWLIDNISKDYVPVYGSSQPYYPPWKWR